MRVVGGKASALDSTHDTQRRGMLKEMMAMIFFDMRNRVFFMEQSKMKYPFWQEGSLSVHESERIKKGDVERLP